MFHTQKKKKKTQIYGCIEFNCYYKKNTLIVIIKKKYFFYKYDKILIFVS